MFRVLNPFRAGEKFQELKLKKRWRLALVIVLLPVLLSQIGNELIQQKNQDVLQQIMEEREFPDKGTPPQGPGRGGGMIPLPMERIGNNQGRMGESGHSSVILIITGILSTLIFWMIKSGIFHIFSKILRDAQITFTSTLHLIAYTYLPFIIKGILELIQGILYKTPSSPHELMIASSNGFLMNFINDHLNLFVIWAILLTINAIKVQYALETKKALLVVLIPYIIAWILQLTILSSGIVLGRR
ncbi:MAG: YIP1 family protein [Theionarchaea archaeon]|nr:YIP1 family protein [Theionarchaea archaeon]